MSRMQRAKGATFEREIANDLSFYVGRQVKRNIGQARDGGDDITLPPFRIECKRRRGIAVYEWLSQAQAASQPNEIPVVIARGDGKKPLVIMQYDDWKRVALVKTIEELL